MACGGHLLHSFCPPSKIGRETRYDAVRSEQTLTLRGVLSDAEKTRLLGVLPRPEPPNPHVRSETLSKLLDDVQRQARAFFDKHLLKQGPTIQPVSGLSAAVYACARCSP